MWWLWLLILSVVVLQSSDAVEVRALLSGSGVEGYVKFIDDHVDLDEDNPLIRVETNLRYTDRFAGGSNDPNEQWQWFIMEYPVDYVDSVQISDRCKDLGTSIINLSVLFGDLKLPHNHTIETRDLNLFRNNSIFGKSLLLRSANSVEKQLCATISTMSRTEETVARAVFRYPVVGHVYFRWMSTSRRQSDIHFLVELYNAMTTNGAGGSKYKMSTNHHWKIYVSDILETQTKLSETNCNALQTIYDPGNEANGLSAGDLDNRHGLIKIGTKKATSIGTRIKNAFVDEKLAWSPSDVSGRLRRKLFLVLFEEKHTDSFLACAEIKYIDSINAKAVIDSGGIKGQIDFVQMSRFEPTLIEFNLTTARNDTESNQIFQTNVGAYKIHELPISPARTLLQLENVCLTTNNVFNPIGLEFEQHFFNSFERRGQDEYPIGDLSGKLLLQNALRNTSELKGQFWDAYLPLQGKFSIGHRSLVIYKKQEAVFPVQINASTSSLSSREAIEPWICGNINMYESNRLYQKEMRTAEVVFQYPIASRIYLRQDKHDPWADTYVIVESLMHSDGERVNDSMDHRWAIHELPPHSNDFYNWQNRCISTGQIWNPFKVDVMINCDERRTYLCQVGDLAKRHETLTIVGQKINNAVKARRLFVDDNLPLSGHYSVMGKSFVIYDDVFKVRNRGERLACSVIRPVHRRKGVVKDWFGNGEKIQLAGKMEFIQQSVYDLTNIEVQLQHLNSNSTYFIHTAPVQIDLEFPCEQTTLFGHWNPLRVDINSSPREYRGTSDQYEMGDLSGKYGVLDNTTTVFKSVYNDTMLPLFTSRSILGRSLVLYRQKNRFRSACSTIERGYSPAEGREIRKIVSFHNPKGLLYGFIRMTQLIGFDNSYSDTIIEVSLKHTHDFAQKVTKGHNWAVFINQVHTNAIHPEQLAAHCISAGGIWNPYYVQLADPKNTEMYKKECGLDQPERCYIGDLGSKVGLLDINEERVVFSDSNLPLEGYGNITGRSVVIFGPNNNAEMFGCANIEPDYDIVKYVNIEWSPRFVLSQFLNDVREVMSIPEWMIAVDSRKTKYLYDGACIQIFLHFKGPIAQQLEQDFNRLLRTGRQDSPSLTGFSSSNKRKTKLSFKQCGVRNLNERNRNGGQQLRISNLLIVPMTITLVLFRSIF